MNRVLILLLVAVLVVGGGFMLLNSMKSTKTDTTTPDMTIDMEPIGEEMSEDLEVVVDNEMLPATDKSIVDLAVEAGGFETLVQALEAANLVETLAGEGPFTVFAPTDEAFAKLPEGTLANLLANPEQLAEVLKYHVVSGTVMSSDVANLQTATALNGKTLKVSTEMDTVKINDSTVTQVDIEANNGVIHVIDTVLIPQ